MGIQSSVNIIQGFGIIGELYDNSPVRGESFLLNSPNPENNVFGRAFSIIGEGVAAAGLPAPNLPYAGIMVNPKASKLTGVVGNPLASSLTVANNTIVEMVNFGELIVLVNLSIYAGSVPGAAVIFDNLTGVLFLLNQLDPVPVGYSRANAVVDRFLDLNVPPSAFALAVIRMTTAP